MSDQRSTAIRHESVAVVRGHTVQSPSEWDRQTDGQIAAPTEGREALQL